MESITVLFLGLGVLWVGQFAMAWVQARSFLRETRVLRRSGRVAVGMGRRRMFRRAYVALAADDTGRVVAARAMTGLTVFARPRALPALDGVHISDLARGGVESTLSPLLLAAATQAAGFLAGTPRQSKPAATGN
ncbi:transcriptional regulator GutM [Phytohabitans rumicis]|uniref:transcriptional regulator GutM n=1 Tax=Phytohabitans rumicis TaxID=1076125 RepID=UPI0015652B8A